MIAPGGPGSVLVEVEPDGTVCAQIFPHSLQQARKMKKTIEEIGTLFDSSIDVLLYTKQIVNPGGCIFVYINKKTTKTTPLLRLKAMTGLLLMTFAKCKAETMNIVILETVLARVGVLFDYDFADIGILSRPIRGISG